MSTGAACPCPYRKPKTVGEDANRMMFLSDVQSLQIDLVCACGLVSIARRAGSREPGASPPAQYPAAQVTEVADPQQYRPAGICRVVPLGTRYSARSDNHQSADADPVASRRFPVVLAVEIETPRRPAKDSAGGLPRVRWSRFLSPIHPT